MRFENGRAEAGRTPSRSVNLRRRIYERQPATGAARELGDVVAIGPPQVEDLVAAFNLDR